MRRRPLPIRLVAVLLTALLSLTGSGAALAHGVAHVREHRAAEQHETDDHHAPHLFDRPAALVHGHEHEEQHEDADASVVDDHGASSAARPVIDGPVVGAPREESHGHARLDAQAASRLALGALLPALPTLVPAAPAIVATMPPPPAASPLRLAEPPTGPPPPSRAPPLG